MSRPATSKTAAPTTPPQTTLIKCHRGQTVVKRKQHAVEFVWTIKDFYLLPKVRKIASPLTSCEFELFLPGEGNKVFTYQLVLFGPVVEEENSLVKVNYIGDPSIGFDYRCAFAKFRCLNANNFIAGGCGKQGRKEEEPPSVCAASSAQVPFSSEYYGKHYAEHPLPNRLLYGAGSASSSEQTCAGGGGSGGGYDLTLTCTVEYWWDIGVESTTVDEVEVELLETEQTAYNSLGDDLSGMYLSRADSGDTTIVCGGGGGGGGGGRNGGDGCGSSSAVAAAAASKSSANAAHGSGGGGAGAVEELRCHGFLLCARSPVFRAMFRSGMDEARTRRILIEDFQPEVVAAMLKFLYLDVLDNSAPMDDLIAIASKYDLSKLKFLVFKKMAANIEVENVAKILAHAHLNNLEMLKQRSIEFIVGNMKKVAETDAWKQLAIQYPEVTTEILLTCCNT